MSDNRSKNKKTKQVLTLQIVKYCCTKCGEEIEKVQICNNCGFPMRVVEVVEKYGDEAEEYLNDLIRRTKKKREVVLKNVDEEVISTDDKVSEMDKIDQELDISEEDLELLDNSVFNENGEVQENKEVLDKGLTDILDGLDNEEDDFDEVLDEFGDEGVANLPEL